METRRNLAWIVLALLALTLLPGCRRGGAEGFVTKGPDGAVTLAIGATADLREPVRDFRIGDYFEEIGVIRPTDDLRTLLRTYSFSYYDDRSVLVFSRDRVVRLSLKDGSFVCEYGRVGRGPHEYIPPFVVSAQDGEVYVSDMNSVCRVYAGDGGAWLRDIPLTDNGTVYNFYAPLGDGLGVLTYSSLNGKPQMFDIVDASGRVVREGTVSGSGKKTALEDTQRGSSALSMFSPVQTGGHTCLLSKNLDTLYRITARQDAAWLIQDPGRYRFPALDEPYQEDSKDLVTLANVCGDLAFLTIGVAGGTRMAVYDMQQEKLLYCIFSEDGVDPPQTYGIPYERDGETIYLAPWMADRDLLICRDRNSDEEFYCFRLKK